MVDNRRVYYCPFPMWCGTKIKIIGHPPLIEAHKIPGAMNNPAVDPCPASLMHWPISREAQRLLNEQAQSMSARKYAEDADASYQEWRLRRQIMLERNHPHAYQLVNRLIEQLRPGTRHGDWPADALEWQLGGRQDEETVSRPEDIPTTGRRHPFGTNAPESSIGGSGMSIVENIARINSAALRQGECKASIQERQDEVIRMTEFISASLDDVLALIYGVMSDAQSEKLSAAVANTIAAKESIQTGAAAFGNHARDALEQISQAMADEGEWVNIVSSV